MRINTGSYSKKVLKTHSNRRRSKFLLFLESADDGVERIVEQAGGFLTM